MLRTAARKTDPITEHVLNLIDQKMLLQKPEDRIKSGRLCEELKQIVVQCKATIDSADANESPDGRKHRKRIESLLREIDNEAASNVEEEAPAVPSQDLTSGLPIDRHALQVQLENVALRKTSHRFAIELETAPKVTPTATGIYTVEERSSISTCSRMDVGEVIQPPQIHIDPEITSASDNPDLIRSPSSGQQSRASFTHRKSFGKPLKYPKQSVIEAREIMDRELQRKSAPLAVILPKRKPKRDEFLRIFFKNRDIVSTELYPRCNHLTYLSEIPC